MAARKRGKRGGGEINRFPGDETRGGCHGDAPVVVMATGWRWRRWWWPRSARLSCRGGCHGYRTAFLPAVTLGHFRCCHFLPLCKLVPASHLHNVSPPIINLTKWELRWRCWHERGNSQLSLLRRMMELHTRLCDIVSRHLTRPPAAGQRLIAGGPTADGRRANGGPTAGQRGINGKVAVIGQLA